MEPLLFELAEPMGADVFRAFLRDRQAFPWFSGTFSNAYVYGLQRGKCGKLTLLAYTLGLVPMLGPFPPGQRIEHTIVEASPIQRVSSTGRAQPRTRWHRLTAIFGAKEVPCVEDEAFAHRFRLVDSQGFPHDLLHESARAAMLASHPSTGFAWANKRIMIHRKGKLQNSQQARFLSDCLPVLTSLSEIDE